MPKVENKRLFNLKIDVYVPGRWFMTEPTTLEGQEVEDVWVFTVGKLIAPPGRLRIPMLRPDNKLDFTTAGMGMTPISSERAASVFRRLAPQDVQRFHVEDEGQSEPYQLVVVTRTVRCIDDNACGNRSPEGLG